MMKMTTMIRVWWVSQGRGHTCLPHRAHTPVTSAWLHPHRVSCFLSVKIISTGTCDLCVAFTGVQANHRAAGRWICDRHQFSLCVKQVKLLHRCVQEPAGSELSAD